MAKAVTQGSNKATALSNWQVKHTQHNTNTNKRQLVVQVEGGFTKQESTKGGKHATYSRTPTNRHKYPNSTNNRPHKEITPA